MEVALQKSAGKHTVCVTTPRVHYPSPPAASFLHTRLWHGLEQQLGQTEVTMATEGISGVAAGYSHEPSTKK